MRARSRTLASSLLACALAVGSVATLSTIASDAHASVSIAIGFDQLVRDADAVAVMTPTESKTVWEDGRIYTYTHLKVEQGVAGELGTGADGWVRTMGGVVGKIGQMVDGEPVFTSGKSSLLFLRKFKSTGTWEVSARAQGQWPIVVATDTAKTRKVTRSANVGVLYPPKQNLPANITAPVAQATPSVVSTADTAAFPTVAAVAPIRLASEAMHDRPFDDVAREVASSWRPLHASK